MAALFVFIDRTVPFASNRTGVYEEAEIMFLQLHLVPKFIKVMSMSICSQAAFL